MEKKNRVLVFSTVILAALGVLAFFGIPNWTEFRQSIMAPDRISSDERGLVIPAIIGDADARYVNALVGELTKIGWQCLILENPFTRQDAASLFKKHGGDLLLAGRVSPIGTEVRFRVLSNWSKETAEIDVDFERTWASPLNQKLEGFLASNFESLVHKTRQETSKEFLERIALLDNRLKQLGDSAETKNTQREALLAYAVLQHNKKTAKDDIENPDGWRPVCDGGCSDIDMAKYEFCYIAAFVAATGRDPSDRTFLGRSPPRDTQVTYRATHKFWRACLDAEGFQLERCQMNEPDCETPLDPFASIQYGY